MEKGTTTMKPTTLEALIYNREARLKDRIERIGGVKDKIRLEEVRYLKKQLQEMLKNLRGQE